MSEKSSTADDMIKTIANALRMGNYIETAAAMVGISKQTLYAWFKKGKKNPRSRYGALLDAVEKSQAEAEFRDLANVEMIAMGRPAEYMKDAAGKLVLDGNGNAIQTRPYIPPNLNASTWRLERRHPRKWGRFDRIENSFTETETQPSVVLLPSNGRESKEE